MTDIHCPHCKKLLMKASLADIEIKCKCGRVCRVKFYSQKHLLLTSETKVSSIVASKKN